MIFESALKEISDRADGIMGAVIMGMDGISIGEHINDPECSIQTVGIEYATALRNIQNASRSLEAGEVQEVIINTTSANFLLRLITPEYFVALALKPDGNFGKARFLLRRIQPQLAAEFA